MRSLAVFLAISLVACAAMKEARQEYPIQNLRGVTVAVVEGPPNGIVVSPGQRFHFSARVDSEEEALVILSITDSSGLSHTMEPGHVRGTYLERPKYSRDIAIPDLACGNISIDIAVSLPKSEGIIAWQKHALTLRSTEECREKHLEQP